MTTAPPSRRGAALFTDIVGFTAFTDARGDAAALEVLEVQSSIVASVLADCGGRVVKELGDGLLLWFDEARAALDAALRLMRAIGSARSNGSFPLHVRMGLHSGPVIERGADVIGHTVNVASRVVDLAGPGEVLVTDEVRSAAGDATTSFSPVGATWVKGVSEPIWLHRCAV